VAKSANAMVSNTIVRKDLWVQFPPAAPLLPEVVPNLQTFALCACDLIGVEYRMDGPWDICVARSRSVAILDEFRTEAMALARPSERG
jgi:hypothetical protein